jgi:histidinol dehydrogenase
LRIVGDAVEARRVLLEGRGLGLDVSPPQVLREIERVFGESLTPQQVVERVLGDVKLRGDEAVRELTLALDGTSVEDLEVPREEIESAYGSVDGRVVDALRMSAERVREFHEAAATRSWTDADRGYGQLISPLGRVGVYVPGGTASYPSTVIMTAVPARVAGVGEVIVCTPPTASGLPALVVLVAADIAGVDRVFAIGGAQAIAAMAYGTASVPPADMICGPGNLFVTLAKKHLFGEVGIDGLYGPTETLVVADETANPTLCAADLLAQAEHDVMAMPVLITTSRRLAEQVDREVRVRLERLDRAAIAGEAVEARGCIAVVDDLVEAVDLANEFAPEHLSLMVDEPWSYVGRVRNAGAVFVGESSHEVLGDYVGGPSHVMPTGGTARFSSGLGVHSFVKISPVLALDDRTSSDLAGPAALIARAEGLTAHAEAAELRAELQKGTGPA